MWNTSQTQQGHTICSIIFICQLEIDFIVIGADNEDFERIPTGLHGLANAITCLDCEMSWLIDEISNGFDSRTTGG